MITTHYLPVKRFPSSNSYLKKSSEQLKDFRPINLLNTDVKILSHILTSRVKTVLDKIINFFQFAYLPNRSIHSALHSIRKRINLLNRSRCVVNIDFSKAYDKIDREYLYDLLKGLNLDEITLKGIQVMYKANIALIEINGHLSSPLEINRGVKQGCPLSALLFILGIEPLLQPIEECPQIRNYEGSKTIGYADDVNCFIKTKSLETLFDIEDFCDMTSLEINKEKSTILCIRPLENYVTVRQSKILGIIFDLMHSPYDLHKLLKDQISSNQATLARCRNMRAKALAIDTFILPKFLYIVRHTTTTISTLKKCQSEINNLMKVSNKMEIKASTLHLPIYNGGVNLPYIPVKLCASLIIDYSRKYIPLSPFFVLLLKHHNIEIDIDNNCISSSINNQVITLQSPPIFHNVYQLLMLKFNPLNHTRLQRSMTRFGTSYDQLMLFSRKILLNKQLQP